MDGTIPWYLNQLPSLPPAKPLHFYCTCRNANAVANQTSNVIAFGTDGTDGPNDAAGAIANDTTIARARQIGLNVQAYLDNNDSYTFFEKLGDLIKTGPTGTNVADVIVALR